MKSDRTAIGDAMGVDRVHALRIGGKSTTIEVANTTPLMEEDLEFAATMGRKKNCVGT